MKPLARSKPSSSNGSITIREVAAEAGVSTATVSRALTGLDGVAKEARARVARAVASLNYRPNRLARGLRLGHRKVIGVIIPDLQNPFFTGVVHGVEPEPAGGAASQEEGGCEANHPQIEGGSGVAQ